MIKKHHYILFTLFCVYISILSPKLFSEGMFMDGLWYAVISRNLSMGLGSFWHLKFTETVYPSFYEHPPLAFGLQSIFFYLFGDGVLVERFYSLFTFVVTSLIMIRLFVSITKDKRWIILPFVFLITIPLVKWCTENNLLENTMSIFTLSAIYFQYKSMRQHYVRNTLLAGISVLFAFLTKGPTGLFVLSYFFWWLITDRSNAKIYITRLLAVTVSFVLSLGVVFIAFPDALEFFIIYLNKQVVGSINDISTVDSRFYILKRCITEELLIPIILVLVFLSIYRSKIPVLIKTEYFKIGAVFLLLGFSGVVPIMISMKQRGFYIMATFPFFALAFALMVYPLVKDFSFSRINKSMLKGLSIVSFIVMITIIFYSSNKIKRSKDLVNDSYVIAGALPKGEIISASPELRSEYSLMGYLMRYNYISLDLENPNRYYLITQQTFTPDSENNQRRELPLSLRSYKLFVIE